MLFRILTLFFIAHIALAAPIGVVGGNIGGGGGNIGGGGGSLYLPGNPFEKYALEVAGIPAPLNYDEFRIEKQGSIHESFEVFQRKMAGAQKLAFKGSGQAVVIVDTGISAEARARKNLIGFFDHVGNCSLSSPCDGNSHGTFIADLIHQIAPNAGLIVHRVLDPSANGDTDDVVAAIRWAIKNKMFKGHTIRAINLSLSALDRLNRTDDSRDWRNVLDKAISAARAAGIEVVAAAGNIGTDTPQSRPGNSFDAFTVGATYFNYRPNVMAQDVSPFTKLDYGIGKRSAVAKPDILAPGEFILAQIDKKSTYYEKIKNRTNRIVENDFAVLSGTSFAAAFVSGAVLVLNEAFPKAKKGDVRRAIETATKAPLLNLGDGLYGENFRMSPRTIGTINIESAYQQLLQPNF